ncbi:MAG: hypothetical protein H6Q68_3438 [Firmicutes bacterium]|nr:hypothetical protein [Bacillota bacterium]
MMLCLFSIDSVNISNQGLISSVDTISLSENLKDRYDSVEVISIL